MAKINDVYITAEKETVNYETDITNEPVEDGEPLTDHVQKKPRILSVGGKIVGKNNTEADAKRTKIIRFMEQGKLVKFIGRNIFSGLIASFSAEQDYKVANGFIFSMTIKEIKIAKSAFNKKLPKPIKIQIATITIAGEKQTKNKKKKKSKKLKKKPKKPSKTVKK